MPDSYAADTLPNGERTLLVQLEVRAGVSAQASSVSGLALPANARRGRLRCRGVGGRIAGLGRRGIPPSWRVALLLLLQRARPGAGASGG